MNESGKEIRGSLFHFEEDVAIAFLKLYPVKRQ